MSTSPNSERRRRGSRLRFWLLLILIVLLVVAGAAGWLWWQARDAVQPAVDTAGTDLQALADPTTATTSGAPAVAAPRRTAQPGSEVDGNAGSAVDQRLALIDARLTRLANRQPQTARHLQLDALALLLATGQRRLHIAGDVQGAREAYRQAAGMLDGLDDPVAARLRQQLQRERVALQALDADPRAQALAALAQFAQALPDAASGNDDGARPDGARPQSDTPWWRDTLGRFVDVRRSDAPAPVEPSQRAAASTGLQIELSLARAAAQRRDVRAWRASLARVDDWSQRLWPDATAAQQRHARLQQLTQMPLASPALPELGSTLAQLRHIQAARRAAATLPALTPTRAPPAGQAPATAPSTAPPPATGAPAANRKPKPKPEPEPATPPTAPPAPTQSTSGESS